MQEFSAHHTANVPCITLKPLRQLVKYYAVLPISPK